MIDSSLYIQPSGRTFWLMAYSVNSGPEKIYIIIGYESTVPGICDGSIQELGILEEWKLLCAISDGTEIPAALSYWDNPTAHI